jgi:hypothetical protein
MMVVWSFVMHITNALRGRREHGVPDVRLLQGARREPWLRGER